GQSPRFTPDQLLAAPERRWYPVIDYSRCTNCLVCLDFCLFGVYGVDKLDRILVENQDSCKRGCPACSRVCPEQAIIFPDYKTPAIAGAAVGAISGLKIDLTKLFGGEGKSAVEQAADERDRELVLDGREAVGMQRRLPVGLQGGPGRVGVQEAAQAEGTLPAVHVHRPHEHLQPALPRLLGRKGRYCPLPLRRGHGRPHRERQETVGVLLHP